MKSECSEHQKRIAAFFLGDLTEEEKQALDGHLATCSQCRSERDSYARAIHRLTSAGDEDVPHHFFVHPKETVSNSWQLFLGLQRRWQALAAGVFALILMFGAAAVSRLQIRSDSAGWSVSFGHNDADLAALKKEMIAAAEKANEQSRIAWIHEMRQEIEGSRMSLTKEQQVQLTTALARMDSRLAGRITTSEGQMRDETQKLVLDVYRAIAQQRDQDLEAINLRFDSTDVNNAIKARQTNEILGTLLQVADLKLK